MKPSDIDWEQRQWEAFIAVTATLCTNVHDHNPNWDIVVQSAIDLSKKMIAYYKKQTGTP